MIEKSPKCTQCRNEECLSVGTQGGRTHQVCAQERQAGRPPPVQKTPLSTLAVGSTQPFPSMSMLVTISQAHFQSNSHPTKKARMHVLFSSPLSSLLYVLFSIVTAKCRFCWLVLKSAPGVLYVQYIAVCCKAKASSQTQGWDTMNIKAVLLCKKQCFCNTLSFAFCLPVAWHIIILCIVPFLSPPLQIMQFFRRFWLHDCKLQSLQDIVR